MRPNAPDDAADLFRAELRQILNLSHPLCRLAEAIDWEVFEEAFGPLYSAAKGRPGLPIRLMVGLHYLKYAFDESDESVVARWLENPYWQYFCGYATFQQTLPLDPTSLVKWRQRVGVEGIEKLLATTVATAQRLKLLKRSDVAKVNVDTTVQEKAIAFPTDARLYHKMRGRLVREAKQRGLRLRQSYRFLGKRALARQGRYAHARQMNRAKRETRKLKTYLGRITRELRRKVPEPDTALATLLERAEKLLAQTRTSQNKLYSVHAPEVECIAKGKAHKRYEFGCKVSMATTSKRNWIVGMQALHGNPYDGHTLSDTLRQVETLTGEQPQDAFCDQGYRGHGYTGDTRVHIVGRYPKKATRAVKRWLRRRAAIEPVIGHTKSDHRMDRNPLKGTEGDQMHALLCGCGFNLAKLLVAVLLRLLSLRFIAVSGRLWAGKHRSPTLSPTLCLPGPRCTIGAVG